jgi:hypothetical protein
MNPKITLEVKKLNQSSNIALTSANWHLTDLGPDDTTVNIRDQSVEVSWRQPDGTWLFLIDNPLALAGMVEGAPFLRASHLRYKFGH